MLAMVLLNTAIVIVVVVIHYEFLFRLSMLLPKLNIMHRSRIVLGVGGALCAHAIEVWIFAVAYYFMHHADGWGYFSGNFAGHLLDCVYFSFTTYTTLGFGDITPHGDVRYLTGIEALTGLVLITWTASYLFIEMQKYWIEDEVHKEH
ncbi:hypothetical protein SIN8267_01142 [Sinobacterium norvegicum]|uniref:Potassium channel domain-containing protein n=1 Tax=Sinobacterium norvegicum TaxID=1641715 RepID=A0ABM9ADM8_9GAMM|nr:potassium channel family protein [Sinobacterium norvegicum]CAH0991041.1 hypothetical protein SIN8267_01142 [Sinobacterium norvegicum]